MEWSVLLRLSLVSTIYTVLGALMFSALEGPHVAHVLEVHKHATEEIKARYAEIPSDVIDNIINDVTLAAHNGQLHRNESVISWGFLQSFFFVSTVVTTIGFGNITPKTDAGRLFCILFALFGIPLNFAMLAGIGNKLNAASKRIEPIIALATRNTKVVCVCRMFLMLSVGWCVFIQVPAFFFSDVEGWDYIGSMYFAFTTLSTLGFGDLAPDLGLVSLLEARRIIIMFWMWTGMAWLSTIINSLQDIFGKPSLVLMSSEQPKDDTDNYPERIRVDNWRLRNKNTLETNDIILTPL